MNSEILVESIQQSASYLGDCIAYLYELIYTIPIFYILQANVAYISLTFYLLWYVKAYLSRTELISVKGSYISQLIEKFPSFHSGYRPTIWCFPAFLNTAIFSVIQRCIPHKYERELLKTPDGGQIAIDWEVSKGTKPIVVLVLPGLTGCSKDNYVSHFVDKAIQSSCKAVVMNYRGIETDLLTPRSYCATSLEDLHQVVEHIHARYPDHKIFGFGISLGGIKLGGYLAKHYDDCLISNAMILSAPFNIFQSAQELEKSENLFFNKVLTNTLSKYIQRYIHLFQQDSTANYDFQALNRCRSLRDIDTHFVTKQFGYQTLDDYYRDACLDTKVKDIRTPTLFLNAADDMFSPARSFPLDKFNSNPNIAMVMTKYGGHISFTEGLWPTGCNYACRLFKDYLNNIITELQTANEQIINKNDEKPMFF